jgi:NADP-dependent 3-hydroxy acid dehydrogenase YdfG
MKLRPRPKVAGKVAIVTGASSGIGQAAARALAAAGACVVLAARRAERLQRLADEINAAGGCAVPAPTDLEDRGQIRRLVDHTLQEFGRIDVLANIAGWGKYDWIEEFTPDELRRQFEVNVVAMAELTRQVVPAMKRQRSGHIINMSSYASRIAVPPLTVYASTKYAVEGLSDGLRRELQPWGIRVSRIHPSAVSGTEFNRHAAADGGVRYKSLPIGRVSKRRVAEAVVRLVERPRREVLLGRLYDAGVFANRHLPGLVDAISGLFVRRQRRRELAQAPALAHASHRRGVAGPSLPVLMAATALAAVIVVLRARPDSGPRSRRTPPAGRV